MLTETLLAEHRLWSRILNRVDEPGLSDVEHGLASNPDSAHAFQNSSQLQWQAFSHVVIREMCRKLTFGSKFEEIYRYGAQQRTAIAKQLQHGVLPQKIRTSEYGKFKSESYMAWETFKKHDHQQVWKNQSGAVFRLIEKLLSTSQGKGIPFVF